MPSPLSLKKMSTKEKLVAMEALWVDLSLNEAEVRSPGWHKDELRKAEKLVEAGEAKFGDWELAKARLRRKTARRT